VAPSRILIVDDSPDDRLVLGRYLSRAGHAFEEAGCADEALARLRAGAFDCLLLDRKLPGMSGVDLIRALKGDQRLRFLPVVMLTGFETEENAVEALAAGADDFVGKSSGAQVLLARVEAVLRTKSLQDELRKVNADLARINQTLATANLEKATALQRVSGLLHEVRELAQRDSLTQLHNHGFFVETVTAEIKRARRLGQNICCLMLDLDYFKKVNDQHGHLIGDKLLIAVASQVGAFFRDVDVVARYGGEEFAVLLMSIYYEDAFRVAERLREQLAAAPIVAGDVSLRLTVSIGLASLLEDELPDLERFVGAADAALYEAKARGRNNTVCYREVVEGTPLPRPTGDSDDAVYGLAQAPQRAYLEAVRGLVTMLEARDPTTREHSLNVLRYTALITRELGLPQNEVEVIGNAAILHDLGKLSISDKILQKDGPLSSEEYREIKQHPESAVQLLQRSRYCRRERELIRHHHERLDGAGYPDGLRGDQIPLGARIIAVADAYDAMRSYRHYRPPLDMPQTVEQLVANAGTQFDPAVVRALLGGLQRHGLLGDEVDLEAALARLG